ncbi:phosphopantetheine-binding protein [Actinacidiphila guanduensis]|jgi:minimal PKS acyl carrier protein|uniref:Minimal PKS acyl carrier protein n=1 Tax=Actinacidiphila guanduensis TaxID=310781 RepID=A0A1H0GGW7_9ACTN|nr:phosphopantetheine-binding protein [Actinacidiphila guanduensis]SDO06175.1 minimal PKS acyl carrier protein [Actinacidiphila guanduensis]
MTDALNAPAQGQVTFEELAGLMKARAGLTVDPARMAADPSTTFEELSLDSLGLLGIVAELENRYGCRIGEEAETCRTPHAFLANVNAQLANHR